MLHSRRISNGMWGISPTMAQISAFSSSKSQYQLPCQHRLLTSKSISWKNSIEYLGSQAWKQPKRADQSHNRNCGRNPERAKLLIDETKQNIMHSYIKYKEYFDRKAKAAPLKENEYCFVLQQKVDHRGSKIPFRDYRWVGLIIVQKVLPRNYLVRRLNTNKTQLLHRIRPEKFVPNQPLRTICEKSDCIQMKKLLFRKSTCIQ